MADISAEFEIVGDTTVVLNNGELGDGTDIFWVTEIAGLGGAPIRTPQDDVPYGDGGLVYKFWKGARHIVVDGVLLIQSTSNQQDQLAIRNDMEEELTVCLESLLIDEGSFAWTPYGMGSRMLFVKSEIAVEFTHDQNYLLVPFHFGLVAADPDWITAT